MSTAAPLDGVKLIPLVNPPKTLRTEPPTYTEKALRYRLEGDAVLRLEISEKGTVDRVVVIQGLEHGLTQEAIRTVRRWRFEPATS